MTIPQPRLIDRRAVIARSTAVASAAALLCRGVIAATPGPDARGDAFARLVAGNTAFALDLYRQFGQEIEGNIVFSPYSISLALAMACTGARGETATRMAQTLALPGPDAVAAFPPLTADLLTRGNARNDRGDAELRVANALWGEKTFPFSPDFLQELEATFDAGLNLADFIHAPGDARGEINDWVAERTGDHIEEIVPEGAITGQTRLILANAIFFAGTWRSTFDADDTRDDVFHLADGTAVDVPFMSLTAHFAYLAADQAQVVELPYVSDGFAMTIILPDEGQFNAIETGLDAGALQAMVDPLASTNVEIHLPRFEFDVATGLNSMLAAMGMSDAFDPDRADFTGMVDGGADERLAISDVLHQAYISVDEEGTEAAAATAVIMGATSAAPDPAGPVVLRVDRPFLFAIRDTVTGTVLFFGRVMDPSGRSA